MNCEGKETKHSCCQKAEKLKTKPADCTPEQIKECHGDEQHHCCESEEK